MRENDVRPRTLFRRFRTMPFGVAICLAFGCGDGADTSGGAGGAGGTGTGTGADSGGGASAGAAGDGGNPRDGRGPMPPAAQGAVSLHLLDFADNSARCAPGQQWVNAPSTPVLIQMQRTSGSEIGMRAVDGVDGSRVVCAVQKSGDKFMFSADITTRRTDGTEVLHPTVLHFDATGIARNAPAAQGHVAVMTDTTLANFTGESCLFSVTPQAGAASLDIDLGRIWASVTCPMLEDPTSPGDGCQLDTGFLVFENCTW
jgi:hypothetical protein